MPLFFGPGNNSFARCIKNCNINKHNENILPTITTTGSPIITPLSNNYVSYTFQTIGNWTFQSNENIQGNIVVVGGGGGGGGISSNPTSGGGGGAGGGVKTQNITIISNATYSIFVGNGGQGAAYNIPATNGQASMFSTCIAPGGIIGGEISSGSVGGIGGIGVDGGGSGGNGGTANTATKATDGNNGLLVNINPTATSYFGGGGGGGSYQFQAGDGIGGAGGGGNGGFGPKDGILNTGGGGAGRNGNGTNNNSGGKGGSGVVIIYFQYPTIPIYNITCPPYKCPEPINSKVLNSNADVDQTLTQTNRVVNAIRTSAGGTIQFGNSATTGTLNRTQYLGRYEGQPGGIGRLSGKNKF